jgi:hypothetical protein
MPTRRAFIIERHVNHLLSEFRRSANEELVFKRKAMAQAAYHNSVGSVAA